MRLQQKILFLLFLTGTALLGLPPTDSLAITPPCTQITNTASLAYKVGGVDHSATSNTDSFYVGVKVIVTVTNNDGANVSVSPGTTKKALKFTVKNDGSATHDYTLSYLAAGDGTASPYGGNNDSFNGTTIAIHEDTNTNGVFDDGTDNASTTINDLAPGSSKVFFIVYTPSDLTANHASVAVYYLIATTTWADGSAITAGSQAPSLAQAGGACNGAKTVDVVFGDADGPAPGANDADKDAKHSDDGAFVVSSASISVTKGLTVISDPVNGTSSPKAIPGAVIEYSIAIANGATAGASATLTTITDALNTNLKIVATAGLASWAVTNSTRATTSGTLTADTADANADGLGHSDTTSVGGTVTATIATILAADVPNSYAAGQLKPNETLTIKFRATIE